MFDVYCVGLIGSWLCLVQKDAYVLCRIFQKSGTGPKNGEQYGAPFIEEEWDEEDEVYGPGEEAIANEVAVSGGPYTEANELSDGGYVEAIDLDQVCCSFQLLQLILDSDLCYIETTRF